MNEPHYTSADPFEDEFNPRKPPKWARPKTYNERLILFAVGRKMYKSVAERDAVLHVTNNVSEDNSGIYPFKWVVNCCEIAKTMRENRKMIQLKGLLTLIGNHERKREWMDKQIEAKGYKPKFQGGG